MRLLILISAAILFTFSACKEEDSTTWQTVAVTGAYTNTPDLTGGFHNVSLPDGSVLPIPKQFIVGGTDNVIGTIDATKSLLEVHTVVLNPLTGAFDMGLHITLYDASSNEIHLAGTAQFYSNGTGLAWFHYAEGTGKFAGILGWLNTSIVTNPATGVHTVTATGEATYNR